MDYAPVCILSDYLTVFCLFFRLCHFLLVSLFPLPFFYLPFKPLAFYPLPFPLFFFYPFPFLPQAVTITFDDDARTRKTH
jgi:hypothetical protein